MKFRGVLIKALAEQADRDMLLIDPAGVEIDNEQYLIWQEFNYGMPPAGVGKVSRAEDGSIVVEGELSAMFPAPLQLAPSIFYHSTHVNHDTLRMIVDTCRLSGISLTDKHADETQPYIELEG